MTAKVENACAQKRSRSISVDGSDRACINCIWYEQYYRRNRGNVEGWIPTSSGRCLAHDKTRGPLHRPCREFERQ